MLSDIFDNPVLFAVFRIFVHNSFKGRIKVLRSLGMSGKEKVIDICCGTGHFSQFLPKNYTGIDNNKNYIDFANHRYGSKFILCDATNLSRFRDKSFDIAFVIDCLHHFPDSLAEKVVKEACRLGKKVVVMDMPVQSTLNLPAKILEKLDRGRYVRSVSREVSMISKFVRIEKTEVFGSGVYKELIITGAPL